jgi:formate dehydrogenase major subunit
MSKTRIIINGKKVFAESGRTILEVVHELGIDHIPNLCLEKQLEPYNSCFLCLVEVKGVNKLVPACSTVIREGMEITTRNKKIMDGRRVSLELLLSNHFADCLPPCSMECPAGVDIQGYIAHIANGDYQEAVKVIKQTNPLPAVCGRVCTRPCEMACRRNLLDSNVQIDFLKRYASDFDMEEALAHIKPELAPEKNVSVAVIGAGPAGLSAAYYLRINGFKVTIFEGMPEPGGMLRYGIPEYRLPYDILDKEIDTILELGVTLKTNVMLGEDMSIRDLFDDGFDAVFLGIGAWGSRSLGVEGQDAEGVLSGIKFLEELGRGHKPELYGKIVVVGGGNTAVDCARTSLRLNADKVTLLYRRTRKEMPANEIEIDAAEHEGVEMHFLAAPVKVITENGRVKALECIRMELGAPDASGRCRPVPIKGSEFTVEADFVFAAIGQNPMADAFKVEEPDFLPENGQLKFTRWESVIVNPDTFETDTDRVFAGGDMVTGAATVIEAIAAGRKAAHSINKLFTEGEPEAEPVYFNSRKDDFTRMELKYLRTDEKLDAHKMKELDPRARTLSFDEVELGYDEDTAREESQRCMSCGCDAVFVCKLREYATEYGVEVKKFYGDFGEYELDRTHPFIELDQNKCILCGRCIRVCSQVVGEAIYGFHTRGFTTSVIPEMGKPLGETSCVSCGLCVDTCPTGAITDRIDQDKPGPWKLKETLSTCGYCGVGCSITWHSAGETVVKATAGDDDSPTRGNTCKRGRFGAGYINDAGRLAAPVVDGSVTSLKEAIQALSDAVKLAVHQYNSDEIAVCVSPRLTHEEIYLIQKLARTTLKTHNVFSLSTELNPCHQWQTVRSSAAYEDIESADVILVTGADLPENHRVVDFMVRRATRNAGKLICLTSGDTGVSMKPDVLLKVKPGTESQAVIALMKIMLDDDGIAGRVPDKYRDAMGKISLQNLIKTTGLDEKTLNDAAGWLMTAGKPVIVTERDRPGERRVDDLEILQDLSRLLKGKLAVIPRFNNAEGLQHMGGTPGAYGIGLPVDDPRIMNEFTRVWSTDLSELKPSSAGFLDGLKEGRWKAVFIFGEQLPANLELNGQNALELLKNINILCVADSFHTDTMKHAGIKIPLCVGAETTGTYTNGVNTIGLVNKAVEPMNGMENWEILVQLARQLRVRYKFDYNCIGDVRAEIMTLVPIYAGIWSDADEHCQVRKPALPEPDESILFKPERITGGSVVKTVQPVEMTSAIWTWFADYWKQSGRE